MDKLIIVAYERLILEYGNPIRGFTYITSEDYALPELWRDLGYVQALAGIRRMNNDT